MTRCRPPCAVVLSLALASVVAGCGEQGWDVGSWSMPLGAVCTVNVTGKGKKQVETDYLPRVVRCENGGADMEALKAQAVAARSYMYYASKKSGSICDGTKCQVYSCGKAPSAKHYAAVKATAGQVLMHSGVVVCSFYVAGAKPSTASCVAAPGDSDPTKTEKWVTYNQGKAGGGVTQTKLGWVNPGNKYNRGCKSQNGAHCLSLKGKKYPEILKFYYGSDIQLTQAKGPCVTPPVQDGGPPPPKDIKPPPKDIKPPKKDIRPPKKDTRPPPPKEDTGPPPPKKDTRPPGPQGDSAPVYPGRAPSVLQGGCQLSAVGTEALPAVLWLALLGLVARRRWS